MKKLTILLTLVMLVACYSDRALAESLPDDSLGPISIPHTPPQPPLKQLPTLPSSFERSNLPGSIIVTRFEFDGNTAFSDEKLTEVIAPFTNRPLTFASLLQAEAAVTKLYTEAGYINSGAVIPSGQTLSKEGGVVKIQIIEGGVEEIGVTGTRRLNSNYVRRRLALATAKPLNQNRLLEALQLLQLDPLIQSISAELSAGDRPELSLLEIRVTEADSFNTEFFADNGRAPSVGSFRRGIRINQGNLFGFGDGLGIEYTNTDGSDAFGLRYSIPLNPRNGTLILGAGLTDTKVVEPPFDRLDIIGDSRYFELGFRQPLIESPTQEFALGLTASRQESKSQLLGEDVPLSAGADEQGETRISALRFFQEWTQRSPQEVFALRSQFSLGLGVFNATINSEPPDSRFFSWRGQGQYVRLLAPETLLVVRSNLQFSTSSLVPLEQFGLGGLRSVRGYRQDVLLTDNGFFGSAEVQLPVLRVKSVEGVLQVVPFIDFGIGWNSSGDSNPDPSTMLGLGLGLQWEIGDRFSARLDYGIPLTNIDDRNRTLQEDGLYFSIILNPF